MRWRADRRVAVLLTVARFFTPPELRISFSGLDFLV